MTEIHQTAIVESGAELGVDVAIGPFSIVHAGARIGDGCHLGPHVTVYGGTTLGSGSRIHAGAILGDLPQDLGFRECETYLKVGSNCVIREGVTLHRGSKPGTTTEIGDHCFLMAFSHCGHNVRLGNGVIVANGVLFAGHVTVGDRAFISGNAIIHQFCHIGRLAMIGGGSGVSKNVPPFCTTHPVTLNRIAALNAVGMRRAGMKSGERLEIKRLYRILYHSNLNTTQALERIETSFDSPLASEISAFVKASERGICSWPRGPESENNG